MAGLTLRQIRKIKYIAIGLFLLSNLFVFEQTEAFASWFAKRRPKKSQETKPTLSELQKLSRSYRQEGLSMQKAGDVEGAKSFFQKAIVTDPLYAVAYNDLAVVYETEGNPDLAEEYYTRAIQVDPGYLSAYSNLALLYENKRDFQKAVGFWQQRVDLGQPDDPWTAKAKRRLNDINLALGKKKIDGFKEEQVMGLASEIVDKKAVIREDDKAAAQMYFQKAKLEYKREDAPSALKEAINALQLDPGNKEISEFIDKVQTRLLSK